MRVAVIGGGVIGLFCAYYLRESGADVTVLERDTLGAGCSRGNGGWVSPSLSTPLPAPGLTVASLRRLLKADSPLYIRASAAPGLARWLWRFHSYCNEESYAAGVRAFGELKARTGDLYRELESDGVEFERREDGMLLAFSDPRSLATERADLEKLAGIGVGPIDTLDEGGLAEAEPGLAGDLIGGLLIRSDAHVRPETLCAGVASRLRSVGVRLLEGNEIRGFRTEGPRVRAVLGSAGEVEVDAVVLAAGAETGALGQALEVNLPIQAGKGYSITIEDPRVLLRRPLYLDTAQIGFTPFGGALRILGTMELSGINRRLDPRRLRILERAARAYLPGSLEGRTRTDWVGMRPITPDGLPLIGRLPGSANAYVASGHQMLGVTLAPATGKALAELVLTGTSEVDLAPFDPARF